MGSTLNTERNITESTSLNYVEKIEAAAVKAHVIGCIIFFHGCFHCVWLDD
jgi:hypothetical protein